MAMESGSQPNSSQLNKQYIFPLVLGFVSLVLQIIGLATPGWLVMRVRVTSVLEYDISMGLWTVNYCVDDECGSASIREFWDDFPAVASVDIHRSLDGYRAQVIIGGVLMGVVVMCLLKLVMCRAPASNKDSMVMLVVSSFCAAMSGFMALSVSFIWGKAVDDTLRLIGDTSPYTLSYSPFITGSAGIGAAGLFVVLAVAAYRVGPGTSTEQSHNVPARNRQAGTQSCVYVIQPNHHDGRCRLDGSQNNSNKSREPERTN